MSGNASNTGSRTRLAAYCAAAAASAAGTASGELVYSGVQNLSISQFNSFSLNLNLDGSNDIRLKNYVFGSANYMGATVLFAPGKIAGFNAGPSNLAYVSNLAPGALIDTASVGPTFYGSMAYGAANPNAQFNSVTNGLIGLVFPAGPDKLFGWVRVSINQPAGTFVVHDWAYDNAGASVQAGVVPEPASLGLLALGAAGLAGYRGRRR